MNLVVRFVGRQGGVTEWKLEGDYTSAHFQQLYESVVAGLKYTIRGFECRLKGGVLELIADTDQITDDVTTKVGQIVQDAFDQLVN